jgi:hypothetical protein
MKKLIKALTVCALAIVLFSWVGVQKSEASTVTKPANSIFFKSALNSSANYYMVQNYKGTTVRAKTTAVATLKRYNENYSYGSVSFIDYDKSTKKTYKTKVSTQAYKKASTKYKLTANNNRGKKVNVKIPKKNIMTKVNSKWYKDSFKYTTYVKVHKKWVKKSKTATIYVPAKYINGYTTYFWKKYTKKATGYFYTPPTTNGVTLAEYNKITIGMTYEQVVSIIGEKLTETSSDTWNEDLYDEDFNVIGTITHTSKSTTWEYELDTEMVYIWRHADFDFEDGKLTYKYQYGLK